MVVTTVASRHVQIHVQEVAKVHAMVAVKVSAQIHALYPAEAIAPDVVTILVMAHVLVAVLVVSTLKIYEGYGKYVLSYLS